MKDGNFLSIDGIFIDNFSPHVGIDEQYMAAVDLFSKFEGCSYSFKRFVPITGKMSKISNSKLVPMIFTNRSSRECREEGVFERSYKLVQNKMLINAIRSYNQKTRLSFRKGNYMFPCNCYDCSIAEFVCIDAAMKYSTDLVELLEVFKKVDSRRFRRTDQMLDNINDSINVSSYRALGDGGQMLTNGDYVWRDDFDVSKVKLRKNVFDEYDLIDDLTVVKEKGPWIESSLFSKLRYELGPDVLSGKRPVNLTTLGSENEKLFIERYYVPAMSAKFALGKDGIVKMYAIPRVNVTLINGRESFYDPAGKSLTYSWSNVVKIPNCISCGYSPHGEIVNLRDYLACFHPSKMECDSCGFGASITYEVLPTSV